jgi:hypothetical protein
MSLLRYLWHFSLIALNLLFRVQAQTNSVVEPGPVHQPFVIPFPAADSAFDFKHRQLFLSDYAGKAVARINLTNGVIERVWKFPYSPESLTATSDGKRLYAALITRPHDYHWMQDQVGYIAEFDLEADEHIRTMVLNIDPGDIAATDSGYLFVAGASGGGTTVNCYRSSGQLIGTAPMYNGSRLALSPSQSQIFGVTVYNPSPFVTRYNFDPLSGIFGPGIQSPPTPPETGGTGGRIFTFANEEFVIGGNSTYYRTSDLRFAAFYLSTYPVLDLGDIPGSGTFAALSGARIDYYDSTNRTKIGSYQLGRSASAMGLFNDSSYLLTVGNGTTLISRRTPPSQSSSSNQSPTVRWLSPISGAVLAGSPITLSIEPEDVDGGIERVELLENGTLLANLPSYPFSIRLPFSPGIHTIEARAIDNLGATSSVQVVQFRIGLPPSVSWISPVPAAPTVVDMGSDFTLEVDADDPDGTVARVDFYSVEQTRWEMTFIGSVTEPPWQLTLTNFNQTSLFFARAFDNDGFPSSNWPPTDALVQLAGPVGDDFYRPFKVVGESFVSASDNSAATSQLFEKPLAGLQFDSGYRVPNHTLWWSWEPPVPGLYKVTTRGSSFDTLLGVFLGSDIADLTTVVLNDDDFSVSPGSTVKFAAYPGTTYMFTVDGYFGQTGLVNLSLQLDSPLPEAPPNDNFANRLVFGAGRNVLASNLGATEESSEPKHAGISSAGPSVWWEWTAPSNGIARLTTEGSSFDTVLAVYTGTNKLISLTSLVSNDDASSSNSASAVLFQAVKDRHYFIAVTGFGGATGNISLFADLRPLTGLPPSNDTFDGRVTLLGTNILVEAANIDATTDWGDPTYGVWWRWRAPGSGPVYISLQGSGFILAGMVFTGTAITNLQKIASTQNGVTKWPVITFNANAGVDYSIELYGLYGDTGPFTFLLDAPALKQPIPSVLVNSQNGSLNLACDGLFGGTVVVLASSELTHWTPISTNQFSAGTVISVPLLDDPKCFFRLQVVDQSP